LDVAVGPDRDREVDVDVGSLIGFALARSASGRLCSRCCQLLERLLGFALSLGPFLLQLGFNLEEVCRHTQVPFVYRIEEPHLRGSFGLGRLAAVMQELGLVPVSRGVLRAIGAVEESFEFRDGRTTVTIMAAGLDIEFS
jgi:hypothetical protein